MEKIIDIKANTSIQLLSKTKKINFRRQKAID